MSIFDSPKFWFCLAALLIIIILVRAVRGWLKSSRIKTIQTFPLPKGCMEKLQQQHPHLSPEDCALVEQGLRQFFMVHFMAKKQYIAMPSQVVDDLWHEFILYTRDYASFCQQAFGGFFHHNPAGMAQAAGTQPRGMHNCWREACKLEGISPANASRLPLLFAIDAKLQIKDGFHYSLDPVAPESDQEEVKEPLPNTMLAGALLAIPVMAFAMPMDAESAKKDNAGNCGGCGGGGCASGGCGGGCGGCGGCGG